MCNYIERLRNLTIPADGNDRLKAVDEIERLRHGVKLYEAMKEGIAIRISSLESENEQLKAEIEKRDKHNQKWLSKLLDIGLGNNG